LTTREHCDTLGSQHGNTALPNRSYHFPGAFSNSDSGDHVMCGMFDAEELSIYADLSVVTMILQNNAKGCKMRQNLFLFALEFRAKIW
jgi:hypothetical protein